MDHVEQSLSDTKKPRGDMVDIFILTKPPHSDRAKFCQRLIAKSEDAFLYLAGDGVYNLLERSLMDLPPERVLACREDLEARGVQAGDKAIAPADFYEQLAEKVMSKSSRVYTF